MERTAQCSNSGTGKRFYLFVCLFVCSFVCCLFYLFIYYLKCLCYGTHSPVFEFRYSLLQNVYTRSGALPASYSVGTVVLSRCTAVKSVTLTIQPPVSAKVKNAWIYLLLPLYTLREWVRKLFGFHLFIFSLLTKLLVKEYTASNDDV
jgi:hypothetical protein